MSATRGPAPHPDERTIATMKRSTSVPRSRVAAVLSLGLLALGLAACSGNGSALTATTPLANSTTTTAAKSVTTTTTTASQLTFSLFFLRGGTLGVSQRTVPAAGDPHYQSMVNLLQGPNPSEAAAGLTTDIPAGTVMRGLQVRSGTATVNLSPDFVGNAPQSVLAARVAQVVYTLTAYGNVSTVVIEVGGTQIVNFGGINLADPVGRPQITGTLPPVLLVTPAVGGGAQGDLDISVITSINGTYEVQLVDPSGKLLAGVTNTAVAGGKSTQSLPFTITAPETGTVKVFARPTTSTQPVQEYQFNIPIAP
jgi:hypothetical protein